MHRPHSSTSVSVALSDPDTVHLILIAVNHHREEPAVYPEDALARQMNLCRKKLVISILGLAGTRGRLGICRQRLRLGIGQVEDVLECDNLKGSLAKGWNELAHTSGPCGLLWSRSSPGGIYPPCPGMALLAFDGLLCFQGPIFRRVSGGRASCEGRELLSCP